MFSDFFKGLKSLFNGHKTVMKQAFQKRVTLNYPEEKREVSENFRGKIEIVKDENDKLLCIGCGLCQKVCPCFGVIKLEKQMEENGKLHIRYERDEAQCIYCGNCVENCPQKALKFTKEYELATDVKSELRNIV